MKSKVNSIKVYARTSDTLAKNLDWICSNNDIVSVKHLPTRNSKRTVLKSPHVNKKAQETYQINLLYKAIVKVHTSETQKINLPESTNSLFKVESC